MNKIETTYKLNLEILLCKEIRDNHRHLTNMITLLSNYSNLTIDKFNIIKIKDTFTYTKLLRLIRFLFVNNEFIDSITGSISKDMLLFSSLEFKISNLWELEYYTKTLSAFTIIKYKVDKSYLGLVSNVKSNIRVYKQDNYYLPVDYEYNGFYFYKGYLLNISKPKHIGYLHNEAEINDKIATNYIAKDKLLGSGFLPAIFTIKDKLFTYLFNYDLDYDSYNLRLINILLPTSEVKYLSVYERPMDNIVTGKVFIVETETIEDYKFVLMFPITYKKYYAYIKEKINLQTTGKLINKKGV